MGMSHPKRQFLVEAEKTRLEIASHSAHLTNTLVVSQKPVDHIRRTMRLILRLFLALSMMSATAAPMLAQQVAFEGETLPEGVEGQIRSLIGDLDIPQSRFEARRQAKRAAEITYDVLNSHGYFGAEVDFSVTPEEPFTPLVRVNAGTRFKYGLVRTTVTPPLTPGIDNFIPQIADGEFATASDIVDAEKKLVRKLRNSGYPQAAAKERNVLGDKDAATIDVEYLITSGPRICLGEIVTKDNRRTKQVIFNRLAPFETGDIYRADDMELFRRRIADTRVFAYANIELDRSTAIQLDQCEQRDVILSLEDANRRTVSAGASYATSEGFGLQAGYELRNFTGRVDTLSANLRVAELERELAVTWTQPVFGALNRKMTLGATLSQEETDAFDKTALALDALYERPWTKTLDVFVGVGFEVGQETVTGIEVDRINDREYEIISGSGGLRYDTTDNILDATQGVRIIASAEPSYTLGGAESAFIVGTAEARTYLGFNEDKFVLAGRIKSGTVFGAEIDDLPSSRRFFAGGGGSVRGYEYQAVGPVNDDGDPLGGRSLLETSVEARWRFSKNMGLVAFVDAGEVGQIETPRFSDLRVGAGLGFRYYTQFGPLRVDLATPLNPEDDDPAILAYISIGQAF